MIYKPYGWCLTVGNRIELDSKENLHGRHLPKVTASSTSRAPLERGVQGFKSPAPELKPELKN